MAGLDPSVIGNLQQPQGMSLSDMLNVARGTQAYKQAQQINPLALQQQQAATQAAQLNLANTQNQIAGGALTGLENSPSYKAGDTKGIKKELESTEKWLRTISPDLIKEGGAIDQAHKLIENDDVEGYKNHLANIRNSLASSSEKYQANLPTFAQNQLGQQFLQNRAAGTLSSPNQQGAGNINPTEPGVKNFNQYQQDLTNRVAGGTQIDLRLNEAENLMKGIRLGAGTKAFADIAGKLQAIGAPQDLVDKAAGGDISAVQSLNKFIAQSVTAGIGAMQGNPTANMMNDYLKNNPDVNSDPRALQRFIDFAHKQNNMAYEEQNYLTNKIRDKSFNPDTHVAEAQQHILNTFVKPQQNKSSVTPIAKATDANGKVWIKYSDGSVRPQ